jgi:hypothetical protein
MAKVCPTAGCCSALLAEAGDVDYDGWVLILGIFTTAGHGVGKCPDCFFTAGVTSAVGKDQQQLIGVEPAYA